MCRNDVNIRTRKIKVHFVVLNITQLKYFKMMFDNILFFENSCIMSTVGIYHINFVSFRLINPTYDT